MRQEPARQPFSQTHSSEVDFMRYDARARSRSTRFPVRILRWGSRSMLHNSFHRLFNSLFTKKLKRKIVYQKSSEWMLLLFNICRCCPTHSAHAAPLLRCTLHRASIDGDDRVNDGSSSSVALHVLAMRSQHGRGPQLDRIFRLH